MNEAHYRETVEAAGSQYQGIGLGLVLFRNSYGSTCSLPPELLTVERVRDVIAKSDALFASGQLHPLLKKFQK